MHADSDEPFFELDVTDRTGVRIALGLEGVHVTLWSLAQVDAAFRGPAELVYRSRLWMVKESISKFLFTKNAHF